MPGGDQRKSCRMLYRDAPHCVCEGLQVSLPGFGKLLVQVLVKPLEQQRHHGFQNVFPAGGGGCA